MEWMQHSWTLGRSGAPPSPTAVLYTFSDPDMRFDDLKELSLAESNQEDPQYVPHPMIEWQILSSPRSGLVLVLCFVS